MVFPSRKFFHTFLIKISWKQQLISRNIFSGRENFKNFYTVSVAHFGKMKNLLPPKFFSVNQSSKCVGFTKLSLDSREILYLIERITDHGLPTIFHLHGMFFKTNTRHTYTTISEPNSEKNLIDNHNFNFLAKKKKCFCLFVIVLRYWAALPDEANQNGNSGIRQPSKTPELSWNPRA